MTALIFDIDGTLWDTREIVARGYNIELEKLGHPELKLTAEYLSTLFGKTTVEIEDILFRDFPKETRHEMILRCMETERLVMAADPCQVGYEGVREVLEELSKKYPLYLVSNSECGYPELLLDKLNLRPLFRGHLCHGDTKLPKGDTIRILMEREGIQSAIYIGDTQGDLEACRKAEIPFIFCRYGFGHPEDYDAAIDDIRDLPRVLQEHF